MKKLLPLVYAFVVLFSITTKSLAQTTAQIGAGASFTSTSGVTPYGTFWHDGRVQYIIEATELITAGLSSGSLITALGFNVTFPDVLPLNGFTIKMDHTTNSNHPGALIPTGSTVYTNASVSPTTGWNTYLFTSNFTWNGSDNIVVEVCFDNSSYTSSYEVASDVYVNNITYGLYTDGDVGCSMTSATANTYGPGNIRPAMQLTFLSNVCTAPPTAGSVVSSLNPICPNTNFSLSLTGGTAGVGQTYQWQSSTDNINWSDIPGATNGGLSTSINAQTYYRCKVTCSNQTDTSDVLLEQLSSFLDCYCTPTSSFGCFSDYIANVTFNSINYNSTCDGYLDNTAISTTTFIGNTYNLSVTTDGDNEGASVWIDYNHSGTFDANELVLTGYAGTTPATYTDNITIPASALTGPTRMRVRNSWLSAPTDPCLSTSYGEAEDYTVIISPVPPEDAGISALESPAQPACTIDSNFAVVVKNEGTVTLVSATINYTVNAGPVNTYNWTGSILPGQTGIANVGIVNFADLDVIKVWPTNPNGVADIFPFNDTLTVTLYESLDGPYTVYGTTPDFATLSDAMTALGMRGICGDVTFNVRSGSYMEQVTVPAYANSVPYTVTIQSEVLDADSVKFDYMPFDQATNYVIGFDESNNVVLNEMTISNTSYYSGTVNFLGGNNKITVQNCKLISDTLATFSTLDKPNVVSYEGIDNNISIINNTIMGGSYAFWMFGNDALDIEAGLKISGNTIGKYFGAGVVAVYQNRPEISNNIFTTEASNFNANIFHLDVEESSNGAVVKGNSIKTNNGGFAINLFNVDAQPNQPSVVANNFVYMGNTFNPANSNGITLQDCSNMNIVFNSVHTRSANATHAPVKIYNGQSVGVNMMNNNLVNSGAGSAVYANSAFYIDQADYNNYFTSSANIAYLGTNYTSLASLQAATGNEAHSFNVDPMFNGDDLHTCRLELDNAATPIAGITSDFDNDTRNVTTPDIGADEFITADNYSLGEDIVKCPADSVWIGAELINNATYYWSPYFQSTPSIYATNPGTYFVQVIHSCGSSTDTIEVTNLPLPIASFSYNLNYFTAIFDNSSVNASSYHWDFGDGDQSTVENPSHIYDGDGTYTVTLTAISECGDSVVYTQTVVVNPPIASIEEENSALVNVYPNPSEGIFQFTLTNTTSADVKVEIMDVAGRIIYSQLYGNASAGLNTTIDITGNASGLYLMKVIAGEFIQTQSIIIK